MKYTIEYDSSGQITAIKVIRNKSGMDRNDSITMAVRVDGTLSIYISGMPMVINPLGIGIVEVLLNK